MKPIANIFTKGSTTQISVAVAILVQKGQYLLQLRDEIPTIVYPGVWGLFGGHLENGETPEAGIERELWEEIGYCPSDLTLFGCYGDIRALRYVFHGCLDVPLTALSLQEGWDMQLWGVDEIFKGERLSDCSGDCRPIAQPHRTILNDFLRIYPQNC